MVQGGEPDPLTEQVDKQDMLRVQVDHGLDIGTHGIRAGVQAPLDRGARTATVFAAEVSSAKSRSKPVQPGARAVTSIVSVPGTRTLRLPPLARTRPRSTTSRPVSMSCSRRLRLSAASVTSPLSRMPPLSVGNADGARWRWHA